MNANNIKEIKTDAKNLFNVNTLLSKGTTNAKTGKNKIKTFIMYLAPAKMNGQINLCPKASEGCLKSCLFTAGRGAFNNVMQARLNKAKFLVNRRQDFLNLLAYEIIKEANKAMKEGYKVAFRLNGTTDFDFVGLIKKNVGIDLLELDNVIFYDYTAILGKAKKYKSSANYIHAFSRKENNHNETLEALKAGFYASVVFLNKLPKTWHGFPVIDGDKADDLMLNKIEKGAVLGLIAKGKAKKDTSGFVIQN